MLGKLVDFGLTNLIRERDLMLKLGFRCVNRKTLNLDCIIQLNKSKSQFLRELGPSLGHFVIKARDTAWLRLSICVR